MTQLPTVSIVTPSFNQAEYLRFTVESVLGQECSDVEYLVYDGGSTDGSVEIIHEYAPRLAFWVSQQDNGQADAITRGWQRSRGEILAWLNSDDTYEPGAVAAVMEVFQRYPEVDVVTGDCRVIDDKGRFLYSLPSGDFDIRAILSGNSLPQQGVFCRRSAVEAVGWLDAELNYVFDWALWLKLWLHGAKFYHLRRTVANFRVWNLAKTATDTIGASLSGGARFASERLSVLVELLKSPEVAHFPERDRLVRSAVLATWLELALLHQLTNESEQAAHYLNCYVDAAPTSLQSLPYPQALAAHLAYLEGDPDTAIQRFVAALSSSLSQANHSIDAVGWTRTLCAETYLVRAWHATHLANDRLAARHFVKAMTTSPKLLFQQRTLAPTVKYLLKALLKLPKTEPG